MWVELTPAMSAATADTRDNSSYQDFSIGSRDSANAATAAATKYRRRIGVAAAVGGDHPRPGKQCGVEQLAAREEGLHAGTQAGIEVSGVAGGQHRREHPERIARQLVCIDGTKRGGHHRNRRPRGAQIVVADRHHAERGEQVGDGGQFRRAADPDGAVPLGGDPLQRAQPFGTGMACHVVGVDLLAYLDQGGVRGHLAGVHRRQPGGELRTQLPGHQLFRVAHGAPSLR